MKKILLIAFLLVVFLSNAQILNPVTWKTSVKQISDSENQLIAKATIAKGLHLYSQHVPENGPIPTKFVFQANPNFLKKGNTLEGSGKTVDDPVFQMKIKYFDNQADFKQSIKLKSEKPFSAKATVEYMVCNDTQCLPPTEVDLVFKVSQ